MYSIPCSIFKRCILLCPHVPLISKTPKVRGPACTVNVVKLILIGMVNIYDQKETLHDLSAYTPLSKLRF